MVKISLSIDVGDVVRVSLDPTIGHEKQKERFCVVLEKGSTPLNLLIILPITNDNGKRSSQLYIPIKNLKEAGLHKKSVIDCYQIRTISTERLIQNSNGDLTLGKISESTLFQIRQRLAWLLDIGEEHINTP